MNSLSKALPLPSKSTINSFLASPNYCIVVMAFAGIAHILSIELLAYLLFASLFIYICLFGDDLLPLIPLFPACYITPSAQDNPGRNTGSVFSGASGVVIGVLGALMVAALVCRIVRHRKQFFSGKSKCLLGLLLLSGTYLLSGIGSAGYTQRWANNLLYAIMQVASLILPYWLLSRGVNWQNVRRDYFAWMGFATGGVLSLEVLWSYCTQHVIVDGIIRRTSIYTGWGMYNNLGFFLAMMIPFAFYLATKHHRGWIGTVIGSIYLICVILTCSRASILGALFIYALCVLIMLFYARNRRHNFIALVVVLSLIALTLIVFPHQLQRLFSQVLNKGTDPSERDIVYTEGLKLFAKSPVLGVSFFSPGYQPWTFATVQSVNSIIPPRWHNTVIQLLTSCGVVGLGAYVFHRIQTVKMLFSRKHKEQRFFGCVILILILCSLLDCHFFNLGPTMFYSMTLAYAEFAPEPRAILADPPVETESKTAT